MEKFTVLTLTNLSPIAFDNNLTTEVNKQLSIWQQIFIDMGYTLRIKEQIIENGAAKTVYYLAEKEGKPTYCAAYRKEIKSSYDF